MQKDSECNTGDSARNTHLPLSLILATAYFIGQWPCTFDVDYVVMYVLVVLLLLQQGSSPKHLTSILQDKSS